ncbi:MMPL family transporter [Nocardia sp. NPDC005998]|uniref:MMPL family transporter n=1 Tax=Nocardia sp. NPDC005998 TaxID=3156894 RepID=UPI0033BA51BA
MAQRTIETGRRHADRLVREIRDRAAVLPGAAVLVGCVTAEFADMSEEITGKLPLVIALVLCCSFVFLIAAGRSIALPIKAIVMHLLATGAALSSTVAVFQWGIRLVLVPALMKPFGTWNWWLPSSTRSGVPVRVTVRANVAAP